jgi:hypothetical protein
MPRTIGATAHLGIHYHRRLLSGREPPQRWHVSDIGEPDLVDKRLRGVAQHHVAVGWVDENRAMLPCQLDAFLEFEHRPALGSDERPLSRQWMRQLQLLA